MRESRRLDGSVTEMFAVIGDIALSRRRLAWLGGLVALSSLPGCDGGSALDPEAFRKRPGSSGTAISERSSSADALERLQTGNVRFAAGQATHPRQGVAARQATAEHQQPWALIHGCVDSRVVPELTFDLGIGEVFTTRTAGAVLDDTIVGSMEFALGEPYGVGLIVVLGHTGCGAVTATVDALKAAPSHPSAPGEVADIVHEIVPVARRVRPVADREAFVDEVVRVNTVAVCDAVVRRSTIIRDAVEAGLVRVVPAVYDLATGRVGWQPDVAGARDRTR